MPPPKGVPSQLARAASMTRTLASPDYRKYKKTVKELGADYAPVHTMSLVEASRQGLLGPRVSELDLLLEKAPTELEYQVQVAADLAGAPKPPSLPAPQSGAALSCLTLLGASDLRDRLLDGVRPTEEI
jgi:hypothetical protein